MIIETFNSTVMEPTQKTFLANDYVGAPTGIRQGRPFRKWSRVGFTTIEPLPFLHGRVWDDLALAYVHALRPSRIRVITAGNEQLDSETWRVTVSLNESGGTIRSIVQEVEVGLPDTVKHGQDLKERVRQEQT